MVNSMTGFAALEGHFGATRWSWELRSVNARGLDLRLRLPDGLGDLEQQVRKSLGENLTRGSVSLSLKMQTDAAAQGFNLNSEQLDNILAALKEVEIRAEDQGLLLTAGSAADILGLRGVLDSSDSSEDDQKALRQVLKGEIQPLIKAFTAARAAEGRALAAILDQQLNQVEALHQQALAAIGDRFARMAETLKTNLKLVLDNSTGADEQRVAQELAMLAVKADVAEELDRLAAHIGAARELLAAKGAVGRKFDFLMQEFNREANTLCSKSGSAELTRIGLDLKTVIDQMREQVQNVE